MQVHIYEGHPTGHIAWSFGSRYFSFHPGDKRVDLGLMQLPLPGTPIQGRVHAHTPSLLNTETDLRKYPISNHAHFFFELSNFDVDRADEFSNDLFLSDMPYILWDSLNDIGSINCVTTSIMIFAQSMPKFLPSIWHEKWGRIFDDIKSKALSNGDWIGHVIKNPYNDLMYVHQFREMIEDLVKEGIATSLER